MGSLMFCRIIPSIARHEDVCKISDDGNPGAFNVYKHFGIALGTLCLALDVLKGAIPVFLASLFMPHDTILFSLVMAAPVLGHALGIFNRFRGGKCIAVSFGVTAGVLPVAWVCFPVLALYYILFSVAFKIKSHTVRSIVTFSLFCVTTGIACGLMRVGYAAIGCLFVSTIAVIRHVRALINEGREERAAQTAQSAEVAEIAATEEAFSTNCEVGEENS